MTGKIAAIAAALAIAAGVAWYTLRNGAPPAPRDPAIASGSAVVARGSGGSDEVGPAPVVPPRRAPARAPVIVVPDASDQAVAAPPPAPVEDAPPAPSLDETFTVEERDRTWAPGRERELHDRLRALPSTGVIVSAPECRTDQCRVTITARDDAPIGTFIGELEEPSGLQGWADMLVLEGITQLPTGERQARVYVRFNR